MENYTYIISEHRCNVDRARAPLQVNSNHEKRLYLLQQKQGSTYAEQYPTEGHNKEVVAVLTLHFQAHRDYQATSWILLFLNNVIASQLRRKYQNITLSNTKLT